MRTIPPRPPHLDDPDSLVDRWRSAARAGGWRSMDDWETPAIHEVASAAATAVDDDAASLRLGRARGLAGVGIAEGLDDLDRLWVLLGDAGAPNRATRCFAEGWADAASTPADHPVIDAPSGLSTTDVLRIRLHDLLRTGTTGQAALVIVDAVDRGLPRFARHLEVAAVAAIIAETLPSAESPSRIAFDRVAALAPRDAAFDEGVIRLRHALERRRPELGSDSITVMAVPSTRDDIAAVLAGR